MVSMVGERSQLNLEPGEAAFDLGYHSYILNLSASSFM